MIAWSGCCWNNSAAAWPSSSTLEQAVSSAREQSQCLFAHRIFDQNRLTQLGFTQLGFDLGCGLRDLSSAAPGAA